MALSILDSSEVSEWMALFFPSPVPLEGDSDGDGFSEIAEYLLGTNPASRISFPRLSLTASAGGYLIPIGILPPRPDASLGVETSNDLSTWTSGSILTVPEGLRLEADGGARFFRLVFSLDE